MPTETPTSTARGWRLPASNVSLPEIHGSIAIPHSAGFWRKLFAFAGPGYLVAVGYMDPGNWATDLAGAFLCLPAAALDSSRLAEMPLPKDALGPDAASLRAGGDSGVLSNED